MMRAILRAAASRLIDVTGVTALSGRAVGRGVLVLNLHRVNPHADPLAESMHPDVLDALLRALLRQFTTTTFEGRAEAERQGHPLAILSFDDGYADFAEYAMPVLHRYRVAANLNVIGASVESGRPPWVGVLSIVLGSLSDRQLGELRFPGFVHVFRHGDDRLRFRNALAVFLKQRSIASRQALLAEGPSWFAAALDSCEIPERDRMLSAAALCSCAPHEIGSHSYAHESMGFQSDDYFEHDLQRAADVVRAVGGRPSIYAFPNGSATAAQVARASALGVGDVLLVRGAQAVVPHGADGARRWWRHGFHAFSPAEARTRLFAAAWRSRS
jgi:peptidoglycan/xylan/chitin deacetylase (PgdA/CDA1 family)